MSRSYTELFNTLPAANLLALLLLIFMRVVPIIVMSPFLGGKLLPAPTKIGLAIIISLFLFPFLVPLSARDLVLGFPLIPLLLKELLIGFIFGFLVTVPFNVATSAGSIIDNQRGSASLQITDPSMSTQTSPIGSLLNQMLIVSFFMIGGIHLFFETLVASYQHLPPGTFFQASVFTRQPFWEIAMRVIGILFSLSVRFAAPPVIAMLMADVFLGIANRLAPQVQISFLGMPFKSLLGLLLLFIGLNFLMYTMEKEMMEWFKTIYKIFLSFPPR